MTPSLPLAKVFVPLTAKLQSWWLTFQLQPTRWVEAYCPSPPQRQPLHPDFRRLGRKEGGGKKKKKSQRNHFTDPKTTMTIKTATILVLQDKSLLTYNKQSIHMAFQTDLSHLVNQKSSEHKENTDSGKPCH